MATTGWGAVGGSAWGGGTSTPYEEENDHNNAPTKTQPPAPDYGAAYAPPTAPDLATTSSRSQAAPAAVTGGFGSSAGAYGLANAGGNQSFNAAGGNALNDQALRRKEAELAAKEKQLKELENKLAESGVTLQKKNWPICYPILYHNIAEDIPPEARRVVREGYIAWWGLLICLCWNLFCTCVILGEKAKQKVPSWFLAVLYLLCGVPMSWWLWYKRLYAGAKADSTFGFVGFFLWFAVHTAFCIWAAIAVPFSANQWSFAGFVTAMNALDLCSFCGIIYLVGAGCWTAEAVWSCWVLTDVFLFFRGKGGIKQAKEKAAQEAALAAFRGTASRV